MKTYKSLKPKNLIKTNRVHRDKNGDIIAFVYELIYRENRYSGKELREIRQKQTRAALDANGIFGTNLAAA